jgi:hypothetical protein
VVRGDIEVIGHRTSRNKLGDASWSTRAADGGATDALGQPFAYVPHCARDRHLPARHGAIQTVLPSYESGRTSGIVKNSGTRPARFFGHLRKIPTVRGAPSHLPPSAKLSRMQRNGATPP